MKDLATVSFFLHPRLHEDLKIRMHYDGFKTQSEFFRACVISYLEKNSQFMEFLDDYKQNEKIQWKVNIKKSRRLRRDMHRYYAKARWRAKTFCSKTTGQ